MRKFKPEGGFARNTDSISDRICAIFVQNTKITPEEAIEEFAFLHGFRPKRTTVARRLRDFRAQHRLIQIEESIRTYGSEKASHGELAVIVASLVAFLSVIIIAIW